MIRKKTGGMGRTIKELPRLEGVLDLFVRYCSPPVIVDIMGPIKGYICSHLATVIQLLLRGSSTQVRIKSPPFILNTPTPLTTQIPPNMKYWSFAQGMRGRELVLDGPFTPMLELSVQLRESRQTAPKCPLNP